VAEHASPKRGLYAQEGRISRGGKVSENMLHCVVVEGVRGSVDWAGKDAETMGLHDVTIHRIPP
jgi:hypothetical protein